MSAAGQEDDAGKTQAEEEVSEFPKLSETVKKLSETVKEEVVLVKENDKVGEEKNGEIKKVGEEKGNNDQKEIAEEEGECSSDAKDGESFLGYGFFTDMKSYEKKALMDFRSKLEEAVLTNKLFKKKDGSLTEEKEGEKEKEKETEKQENSNEEGGNKGKEKVEEEKKGDKSPKTEEEVVVDKDIALWGVPLLPSKGDQRTDVLLMKFLRAREFRPAEALDMLKSTLEWRKENRMDSIMEEDFGNEYESVGYMKGVDREGHPVCYNVLGAFANEEMYNKTIGSEAGQKRFLRWRMQLLEKEIQKLDFGPKGISTLVQITDLKDTPGPSRRDLRLATKKAVAVLQDNYPEFIAKIIFVNVPFWYYAYSALFSGFLTPRTKTKSVFSRPSRVTDTLVKYIAAEEIPAAFGGLRREDDPEFTTQDAASEVVVKAGTTETIEIPAPEVGSIVTWEVMIVGWDVSYKEEFVPTEEESYTVIVKKERKISWQQESIRNSFKNKEAGKVVITIENGMFKKKRLLYRYKIKN